MPKKILLGLAVLALSIFLFTNLDSDAEDNAAAQTKQEKVRAKGAEVMPFDLDKTTHVFNTTDTGGVQQVRAKDPQDTDQIELIKSHLREEARRFQNGDFADPSDLHGEDMPGLTTLKNSSDQYEVEYKDLPDGAQLQYITDNEEVIQAFHSWFAAQLHDHGKDATDHM